MPASFGDKAIIFAQPRARYGLAVSVKYVLSVLLGLIVLAAITWKLRTWPPIATLISALGKILTSNLAPYVYIVLGLLLLTWLVAEGVNKFAKNKADSWSAPLQPHLHASPNDEPQFRGTLQIEESEKQRLRSQYAEIRGRMLHHLEIMAGFFANYYMAINMVSLLGAVSGICLFYIANKGWAGASPFVITVGVYTTVAAAYYLSFVTVFKQQENISDNKFLYLQYVALGNELLSYCATGTSEVTPPETPEAFIRRMDKRMAMTNNIAIGFDYTKIVDYKHILTTSFQAPGQAQVTDQGDARMDGAVGKDKNDGTASPVPPVAEEKGRARQDQAAESKAVASIPIVSGGEERNETRKEDVSVEVKK